MDKVTTGIRTHDPNPGLVAVSGGLVSRYVRKTRLMGAAAQVITLLSGLQVVEYEPTMFDAPPKAAADRYHSSGIMAGHWARACQTKR